MIYPGQKCSLFDVKHMFYYIELDEPPSHLIIFATPFGRYHWVQIPMGISLAPEVFHCKLNGAL